jgi:hypothetical protein
MFSWRFSRGDPQGSNQVYERLVSPPVT